MPNPRPHRYEYGRRPGHSQADLRRRDRRLIFAMLILGGLVLGALFCLIATK